MAKNDHVKAHGKKPVMKFAEGGMVPALREEAADAKYNLDRDMYDYATRNDTEEKIAGKRFHDSGMRIPGRQKGRNDDYSRRGHPKRISPMINEKWSD